jgi:hypothetical protein
VFVGQAVLIVLFCAVCSVGAFFGADLVHMNRQPVHGPTALAVGAAVAALGVLLLAPLVAAATCFGLWLYSFFRPLRIRVDSIGDPHKLDDGDEPF